MTDKRHRRRNIENKQTSVSSYAAERKITFINESQMFVMYLGSVLLRLTFVLASLARCESAGTNQFMPIPSCGIRPYIGPSGVCHVRACIVSKPVKFNILKLFFHHAHIFIVFPYQML